MSNQTSRITRRDDCRLCGSRNLELVVQLAPTPVVYPYVSPDHLDGVEPIYPLDLFLCLDCGYTGMLDVVDRQVLWEDSQELTSRSLGVVEDLRQQAEDMVARMALPKDSLVIDIGSNDGTLLKAFQEHGMRVLGVEPATYVAKMASDSGIPTISDYFSEELAKSIRKEWGAAKIITANRVVANVDDMVGMARGVHHLLAPDGLFVFETGYLVDILENDLFETVYHEHLGYDSVKPLDKYFRSHQMELINVEHLPLKGGTLRGTVQLAGGARPVSQSVSAMIANETALKIHCVGPFKAFTKRIDTTKHNLLQLLNDLGSQGMTIAGYGTAQACTTMIFHFDLGSKLSFLVDDDPRNINHFSPSHRIPVLSPQAIYEKNPGYVLVLAWRYAEPIIKKHQAYLDQGGHFIIPMPKLRVI